MNTYLVPVWKYNGETLEKDFTCIHALDEYDAMIKVEKQYPNAAIEDCDKIYIDTNFTNYTEISNAGSNIDNIFHFTLSEESNKMNINKSVSEEDYMDNYDYMYWGDYNAQIQKLADKALPEMWNFEGKHDNLILKNYLKYTFSKLQDEGKIVETDSYCVFNTGLFSRYNEPIYVYAEPAKIQAKNKAKWNFKDFKDTYELGGMDILSNFPERADYFSDPSRLIFNWHYKINVNYKHILDDLNTAQRLPDSLKNSNRPLEMLRGVIDTAIQRVISNYKLAVPHYYQDKIQLLIPLCFGKDDTPDVALVLNLMKNNYYQATTCLSMEMAYIDARLITKPESNWLIPENIKEDNE